MHSRSYHFIPANKPELFDRSFTLGADCYVFDLEDAVPTAEKRSALAFLANWIKNHKDLSSYYVRLNGDGARTANDERDLLLQHKEIGVVLPKVDSAKQLQEQCNFYGIEKGRAVIGLIEGARGLMGLKAILDLGLLRGIGLGLEDFFAGSVYQSNELEQLTQRIRTDFALHAMAYRVEAIDTISLDFSGNEGIQRDVAVAKSAGMTGKFSIHPSQISAINHGFFPSAELVEQARRHQDLCACANGGVGYLSIDGETLSPPKLKKLTHVLEYVKHYGKNE